MVNNYSKYSKKREEVTNTYDENPNQEPKEAVITRCNHLFIREKPSQKAKPLAVLDKYSDITVDLNKSTKDFYKIYAIIDETLFEGYSMKEFIKLK